jgi:hypothetical protein
VIGLAVLCGNEHSANVRATLCPAVDLESRYDRQFKVVFDAIRELMTPPAAARASPTAQAAGSVK